MQCCHGKLQCPTRPEHQRPAAHVLAAFPPLQVGNWPRPPVVLQIRNAAVENDVFTHDAKTWDYQRGTKSNAWRRTSASVKTAHQPYGGGEQYTAHHKTAPEAQLHQLDHCANLHPALDEGQNLNCPKLCCCLSSGVQIALRRLSCAAAAPLTTAESQSVVAPLHVHETDRSIQVTVGPASSALIRRSSSLFEGWCVI